MDSNSTDRDQADGEAPEYFVAALQSQIKDIMNAALRPHGLKLVDWRLLQCLAREGALSVHDLSRLAVVERTVTSRLVDRLIERGFATKAAMETDRRFAMVSITPAGRDRLAGCDESVARLRARLFEGVSGEEQGELVRLLRLCLRNAHAIAGGA